MSHAKECHRPPGAAPRPKRKSILLFLLFSCLGIPLLCLVLLEFALRASGYGYPARFFARQVIDGKACYVTNYKFSWRFFPRPMARWSSPLVVPAVKPVDVVRIFILGSSAAQGDPEAAFSFSRILEVMLKQQYAGKHIEVYNTAATAINSNVILPIARDCLRLQPDLFIVYSGNNEVIGPYGLSAVLTPFFSSRAVIKAQVWLEQTKIGQLLQSLSRRKAVPAEAWQGMELFLKHKINHNDPNLQKIYRHYHDNIAEICRLAQKAGTKVVLSTLIVNTRDCAPFVSLHKPSMDQASLAQWESEYAEAQRLDAAGQWQAAADQYVKAAALDDEHAELQFRLGHCRLRLHQTHEARSCFEKAREYDALRFRADSGINQAVRKVAGDYASKGVYLADAEAAAQHSVLDGIPGASLLYDHVHLSFEGNYLLAACVLEQTEKALALKSSREKPDFNECKDQLAYTAFGEKRILEKLRLRFKAAPFSQQYSNPSEVKALEDCLAALEAGWATAAPVVDTAFRKAIAQNPADWWLHMLYLDFLRHSNRPREAYQQAEAVFKLIPFEYLSLVNMGKTLHELQQYDKAEEFLNQAITLNPYFTTAYESLAELLETQRKFDRAEQYYKKGGITTEQLASFYSRAGKSYANERQLDIAIAYFKKAMAAQPDFEEAEANLKLCQRRREQDAKSAAAPEVSETFNQANRLLKEKQYDSAIELYQKVVALDPEFSKAHNNLGVALVQVKRYEEARTHFAEAIRLDPELSEAYPNLAALMGMQGKHAEAIGMLQKAIAIKPTQQLYKLMGNEYLKLGNNAEAIKCQEQASQLARRGLPPTAPRGD
jgi:tetratricopeptide (TPR) repeat protein